MKKFDVKKLIIVLVIIALVVIVGLLLGKSVKDNYVDKKDLTKYEENVIKYYLNLSGGYNTAYKGLEVLYASDETKLEDITEKQLITTAINYVSMNGENTFVDYATMNALYKDTYPEIKDAALYSAKDIRAAIKTLFGIDNFANPTIKGDVTSLTGYTYLAEEDIYIVVEGDLEKSLESKAQSLDYALVGTEVKDGKIVTTVAIAYRYMTGDKYKYASDRAGTNVVTESKEFPKDKIDEFDKYAFTLAKTKDGKSYIFESVKKVK